MNKKIILIIVFIIVAILAATLFLGEDNKDVLSSELVQLFQDDLSRAGVERVGQPIEGFSAFIYLEAFPGFDDEDFDGVRSLEGLYKFEEGELVYERTAGNTVTSAEDVISSAGYETLLQNFSLRVGVEVETEADVATLLEKLREGDIEQNSYIHDDFSIWHPEGWYPYENGPGVFFVRDADLEIPQNTDGFALGPYFHVSISEISVDEMFAQNLWTEGSEFLISRNDVRFGADEAIRVVTNAAGAGGEVLHYVFEADDGRVFVLSHYPYDRGSSDTDDFERVAASFMINYVVDTDTI